MSQDGIQRSAILLMSLGEEEAVEVFKCLGPREVQKLGPAMARLSNVTREQVAKVLREFRRQAEQQCDHRCGFGPVRALGVDARPGQRQRLRAHRPHPAGAGAGGIENLKWMDAGSVAELIQSEHPQIIATILVHLDADHASEILAQLPERLRNDVDACGSPRWRGCSRWPCGI